MKKLLIALCVAALLMLSGCGTNGAWKKAKQENPLQIPPGLDHPATTNALTIPAAPEPKPTGTDTSD